MNWKRIRDTQHEVSDEGVIRNINTGKILTGSMNNSGYKAVHLQHGKNPEFVHRLVAEAFVNNTEPKINTDVNHIDGNKLNNKASNLEWVTRSENVKLAYQMGLNIPSGGGHNKRTVRVKETGAVYKSQQDCAVAINGSIAGVSMALNGVRKSYKGYHLELI